MFLYIFETIYEKFILSKITNKNKIGLFVYSLINGYKRIKYKENLVANKHRNANAEHGLIINKIMNILLKKIIELIIIGNEPK